MSQNRFDSLLETTPDYSKRSTYSYYRKDYQNPATGDIIELQHYSSDYNSLLMVTDVLKDGVYKVIEVRQYGFEDPRFSTHGNLKSRNQLYIPEYAREYIYNYKTEKRKSNYLFMQIFNLLPFYPRSDDE